MTTYEVGQIVASSVTVKDTTNALTNLGTAPTCTVSLPGGTSTSATVTNTSTGVYQATLTTTLAGRHTFRWSSISQTNSGGFPYSDIVDVWPNPVRLIIPLADAKAALNIPASVTSNDDEIRLYIATATEVVEDYVGPVLTETGHTWTASGGTTAILLPEKPTTLTTVTENGNTLTENSDYIVDYNAGILYRGSTLSPTYWSTGLRNVAITYTVGGSSIAPNIIMAARELVRIYYQTSQQGGRPAFGGAGEDAGAIFTPSGYGIPPIVETLLSASESSQVAWFG